MNVEDKAFAGHNLEEQLLILELKKEECLKQNSTSLPPTEKGCGLTWDGVLCWLPSTPGVVNTQPCPNYLTGFYIYGNATRECTEEGQWFVNPDTNTTWTNLTQCYSGKTVEILLPFDNVTDDRANHVVMLKTISQLGYCISLISLIVAFGILATFRRLRCPRNLLHMHLFVSFILRASLSLLKDTLFVAGVGLPSDLVWTQKGKVFVGELYHNWGCKVITTAWQFFIMTNYSWILMEGLYLHNLIFLALFSDTSTVTGYITLGWSLPLLNVIPWVIVRAKLDDNLCWTTYDNRAYALIIEVPIVIFMLVNFILFLNIVRVLLLKLTASISEDNRRYRRWAKSTLVLVPLFGVHTSLLIWMSYIDADGIIQIVWLYCDQIFSCFQGFFVAVLYCFLNGEVRAELSKKWDKARASGRWQQYSLTEGPNQSLNNARPRGRQRCCGGGKTAKNRPWLPANLFGTAARKRDSTVETCITTFNSTCNPNTAHDQTNLPESNERRRSTINSQHVDKQPDSAPNKMLVCSV